MKQKAKRDIEGLRTDCTAILLPHFDHDEAFLKFIKSKYARIFELELDSWSGDKSAWPKKRSYPDDSYKEGARILPSLVPIKPDDPSSGANRKAWEVLSNFNKPFLTAFSDGDPITGGGDRVFQKRVPGAKDQPHTTNQHPERNKIEGKSCE